MLKDKKPRLVTRVDEDIHGKFKRFCSVYGVQLILEVAVEKILSDKKLGDSLKVAAEKK